MNNNSNSNDNSDDNDNNDDKVQNEALTCIMATLKTLYHPVISKLTGFLLQSKQARQT